MPPQRRPLEERFLEKVDKQASDECWKWKGSTNKKGYGKISIGKRGEGKIYAHRLAWELKFGTIPDRMEVCHSCDNPPCVNPNHLFLGTRLDNTKDCILKGRRKVGCLRGEKNPRAKLTLAHIQEIRKRFESGLVSQGKLAKIYGVRQQHISLIVRGKSWRKEIIKNELS